MIELHTYASTNTSEWDAAVRTSRNGTFLFERGFMDYHADRFEDASLIFTRKGKILALLPQSRHGDEWRSHGGLTYGGLVLAEAATVTDAVVIYDLVADHAAKDGISRQRIAPVPHIYHRQPCEEENYVLHRTGARWSACGVDSVIALGDPLPMATMRRRAIRKAERHGLRIDRGCPPPEFHALLTETLTRRHATRPVHSADEMVMLQGRFPDRIACQGVRAADGTLLAGLWLFATDRCVHAQYIANSDAGRVSGALDLLLADAIARPIGSPTFFSFGISNDPAAAEGLNEGLIRQKTSFGARAIACNIWERSFDGG